MDYALTPTRGPPRVIRFTEPGGLPDYLCVLHKEQNVLLINRERYDKLGYLEQHMLLRTHATIRM
jgi:hypothetical protein